MRTIRQLLFLGTGHGMPVRSACSSILLEDGKDNLLIDTSGGHEILQQFHKANRKPQDVRNIFISHYDSDHILGIVPLVRVFHHNPAPRTIYCSQEVKEAIDALFTRVAHRHFSPTQEHLTFVILKDRDQHEINGWKVTFFDIRSTRSPQMGFSLTFSEGEKLTFLGDEPLKDHLVDLVLGSDILIHEAFCLHKDEATLEAHKKNHGPVKEAALNATRVQAKTLVLFHMEDKTLDTRKEAYTKEARNKFAGEVFVPVDLDFLEILY